jgi:hypothetical protein
VEGQLRPPTFWNFQTKSQHPLPLKNVHVPLMGRVGWLVGFLKTHIHVLLPRNHVPLPVHLRLDFWCMYDTKQKN